MQDSAAAQQRLIHGILAFPVTKELSLVRFLGLCVHTGTFCPVLIMSQEDSQYHSIIFSELFCLLKIDKALFYPIYPSQFPIFFPSHAQVQLNSLAAGVPCDPSRLQRLEPVTSHGQRADGDGNDLKLLRHLPAVTSNGYGDIYVAAQMRN